jgi:hypothetical protein
MKWPAVVAVEDMLACMVARIAFTASTGPWICQVDESVVLEPGAVIVTPELALVVKVSPVIALSLNLSGL